MIKTELGLLPADWKIESLKKLFKTFPSASFSREEMEAKEGVACVHYGDIHKRFGKIVNLEEEKLPLITLEQAHRYKLLKDGDVLLADASEDNEGIGKSIVVLVGKHPAIAGLHTIPLRANTNNIDTCFPTYLFAGKLVKKQIEKLSEGTKVNSITFNKIGNVLLPLPPTKDEQKRIATALYDIDTLIRDLDRTIEKKQNIRQGAMEQLLSGKKRLPGFKGEWTEFVFDNIFKSISTRGKEIEVSDYLPTGKYPIIDQGKEQVVGYTNYSQPIMAKGGGYLVFGDHTRIFKYISRDFYVGADGTKVLECKDGYYPAFMFYKCLLLNIPNTGYNRHFVYLKESAFYIPTDIKEQYAIADTLTAMDDEIAVLQMERDKYANIRSGMMDDLLTGRKRL